MLIPLTTDRPRHRSAALVYGLIAVNTVIFLVGIGMQSADPARFGQLVDQYAVSSHGFRWYQLISSAFLHSGWLHLIFNMIMLAALGPNVEDKLGHLGFAALYFAGAAASGAAHIVFSDHPAIGASGAIAAVTGAYLVLFPKTKIICFMVFYIIGRVALPAWWFIGFNIAMDLFSGFGRDTGVAHAAHLGGYAFGMIVAMTLLWTRVLTREPYDLFTVLRQWQRRKAISSAARQFERQIDRQVGAERTVSPEQKALYEARANIARLVASGRLDAAADAYRVFVDEFGVTQRGTALSRDQQLKLAEYLIQSGDRATAAKAFEAFGNAYPSDREAPPSLLMAGLLLVKNLGRASEAGPLLERALPRLTGDERTLAQQLISEIGPKPTG